MPLPLPPNPDGVPMGANLVADRSGATFRCWAPRARNVAVHGDFNGWPTATPFTAATQLTRRGDHWVGFVPGAKDGDEYKFFVEGVGTTGYKRDPWARELTRDGRNCILRDPDRYRWHDRGFRMPAFDDLVLYQLHVGVFHGPNRAGRVAKFLDVLRKLDYLLALGVNAVQLLPIAEWHNARSRGYEGVDIFSPEMDYTVPPEELEPEYLQLVNGLRARHGVPPLTRDELAPQSHQLKAMVELFHLNGIAVLFDVVYNHGGMQMEQDPESIWFFDRAAGTADIDSLYFSDKDWTGPMWALYKDEVKQFLIENAVFWLREYHADGFRYDETSAIVYKYDEAGRRFCRDLSATVRAAKPEAIQIAEFWENDRVAAVRSTDSGGLGFDAAWHDGLRIAARRAVNEASFGAGVDMGAIKANLWAPGFPDAWRAVHSLEDHDIAYKENPHGRVPRIADRNDSRSFWAKSRTRVAMGLLLTAPCIPMLFMGQEFLEDKPWADDAGSHPDLLLWWDGLDDGQDHAMAHHLLFTQELIRLRRAEPALRRGRLNVFHCSDDTRVIAFHRWLEGEEHDVVVVASLNDSTWHGYEIGLPVDGPWREVFNSDVYENYVNPNTAGNGGVVQASWDDRDGLPASARITIPANGLLVFAR